MERKILPFYMTYPKAVYPVTEIKSQQDMNSEDERMMIDIEYFQQIYPTTAKYIQKEIVKAMNVLDYDGSIIYDEYPDQFYLYKMAKDIKYLLQKKVWDGENNSEEEAIQLKKIIDHESVEEYILLVLFQEILKRRQNKKKSQIHFF